MSRIMHRLLTPFYVFFQKFPKKNHKALDFPYATKMSEIHYTEIKGWRWKNFTPKELACKGTSLIRIDEYSLDCLQNLREAIQKPLYINSGYRSASHNKAVGGSPNSQHLLGKAFDIRITPEVSRETIKKFAKQAGFKGIGDYSGFVHVDTGPERYWDMRG